MWDDGNNGTRLFGVQTLEWPLEVRAATADGRDGIGGVLTLTDIDSVVAVSVSSFSYLLWIGYLHIFCFV